MAFEPSPELIALILIFLDLDELKNYVTVSKSWQYAVERCTFRTIHLKSTDLDLFRDIFVDHRRAALADLSYDVILPTYSDHQCARFETDEDKRYNNEALTEAIHRLFSILHSWNQEIAHGTRTSKQTRSISFKLNAYSPMDVDHRENVDVEDQRFQAQLAGGRKDLFDHRYEHSFLRVLKLAELPELLQVTSFYAEELCYNRRIEGSSLAGIAGKLPNLETIVWAVNDDEKGYPDIRRQHRYDFALSLSTLSLQSLRNLHLNLFNIPPTNHNFNLQSVLLSSSLPTDHLSLVLHKLSQSPNLTTLTLQGDIVISPSFFWPENQNKRQSTDPEPDPDLPLWPHLQHLEVFLNVTLPNGDWFYLRDPDDPDDDDEWMDEDAVTASDLELDDSVHSSDSDNSEVPDIFNEHLQSRLDGSAPGHHFRKVLDAEKIQPMLIAMAHAATRMPEIRRLVLFLSMESLSGVQVEYLAPGEPGPGGRMGDEGEEWERANSDKKTWHVIVGQESKWKVPEELVGVWKEMGSAQEDDHEVLVRIDEY